jgi:hypothetical protein
VSSTAPPTNHDQNDHADGCADDRQDQANQSGPLRSAAQGQSDDPDDEGGKKEQPPQNHDAGDAAKDRANDGQAKRDQTDDIPLLGRGDTCWRRCDSSPNGLWHGLASGVTLSRDRL